MTIEEVVKELFRLKWSLAKDGKRIYFKRVTDTHLIEISDMMDMTLPESPDEQCLMTIIDVETGRLIKQLIIPSLRWLVERRKANEPGV